jgi:N-methylhydantoinase B
VQFTLSQLKGAQGIAEGGAGLGPGCAVLSGMHPITGAQFGGHIVCERNGGPATDHQDGWLTYAAPATNGLMYMDSVEKVEQRFPIRFKYARVIPDSGGAGKFCGAPGATVEYGPTQSDVVCGYTQDMTVTPARGVQGGGDGSLASAYLIDSQGAVSRAPNTALLTLVPGQRIKSEGAGGGGYGDPLQRDPKRVLADFRKGYITAEAARHVFGVVIDGALVGDSATINLAETERLRAARSNAAVVTA